MIEFILLFIAFLSNLLLGLFVLLKNPKQPNNISYSTLAISISLWALAYAVSFLASDALLWTRLIILPAIFIPPSFIAFCETLHMDEYEIGTIEKALHVVVVTILLLALPTPYYITTAKLMDWGLQFTSGPFYIMNGLYLLFGVIYGITVLIKKYRISKGAQHTQIQYIFMAAMFGGVIGVLFAYILPLSGLVQFNKFSTLSSVIVLGFIAYAITKHELMDIRLVITRSAAYGIVGALLVASFALLNARTYPPIVTLSTNALLGLFWAFSAHRLREYIQTPLEEKWITGWYDPNRLVNRIAQKLVPVMDRAEAFKVVADELKEGVKIKQVEIITDRTGLDMLSSEGLKRDVARLRNKLHIPLASSDRLEGALALGPKISEDPYSEKDITLFGTVAIQALAILDRIRPYEKIKGEFEANQKKLYDAEKQLERSQRLAALGAVAAGVAHEIRNPLGIIQLSIEQLTPEKAVNENELTKFKEETKQNIRRITDIIRSMLSLSKSEKKERVEIDINETINSTLKLFAVSRITLEKELTPLPKIMGNSEELKQVFINIFDNAIHAMPEGGSLKIKTHQVGNNAVIEVSDTGKGIVKEDLPKIFDPFFSTRHEGAGLGLSIVYRIVREHDGEIEVKSRIGKGTTFILRFPGKV